MYNIIVIRAHGNTIKEFYEKLGDKDKVIFQCAEGDKIPYWDNIDGATVFLKRAISKPDGFYPFSYEGQIPKTSISGINEKEFEICYKDFSNFLFNKKWEIYKTDFFLYPNEVAIKYHWFKQDDTNLLHCAVVGSSDKHTLGKLIEILKKEFSFFDNVYLVPICRTFVNDIIDNIDTLTIESSGHFSYKLLQNKELEYLEEDILSAIERNDKIELNTKFFFFLKNSGNLEKESLRHKVINDYVGLNIPKIAEKVLDYIDTSLCGEIEFYKDF